jgi:hypothetical protein
MSATITFPTLTAKQNLTIAEMVKQDLLKAPQVDKYHKLFTGIKAKQAIDMSSLYLAVQMLKLENQFGLLLKKKRMLSSLLLTALFLLALTFVIFIVLFSPVLQSPGSAIYSR